jgi:hypothetical protein
VNVNNSVGEYSMAVPHTVHRIRLQGFDVSILHTSMATRGDFNKPPGRETQRRHSLCCPNPGGMECIRTSHAASTPELMGKVPTHE